MILITGGKIMSGKTSLTITLLDKDGNKINTGNEHAVIRNNKQLESLDIYKDISRVDLNETHDYKYEDELLELGGKWVPKEKGDKKLEKDPIYQARLKRAVSHHFQEHQFTKTTKQYVPTQKKGKKVLTGNSIKVHTIGLLTAIEKNIFYGLLLIGCKRGVGTSDLGVIRKIEAEEFILRKEKKAVTFETSIPEIIAASGFTSNNKHNYNLVLDAIERLSKVRINILNHKVIDNNGKSASPKTRKGIEKDSGYEILKNGGPTNLISYTLKELNSKDKKIEVVLNIVNSLIILDPGETVFSCCPISLYIRNNLKSKTAQLLYDYLPRTIPENKNKKGKDKVKTSKFSSVTLYNMLFGENEGFCVLSEIEKINNIEYAKDRARQLKQVHRNFDKIYPALLNVAEIKNWEILKSETNKRQDAIYHIKPL